LQGLFIEKISPLVSRTFLWGEVRWLISLDILWFGLEKLLSYRQYKCGGRDPRLYTYNDPFLCSFFFSFPFFLSTTSPACALPGDHFCALTLLFTLGLQLLYRKKKCGLAALIYSWLTLSLSLSREREFSYIYIYIKSIPFLCTGKQQ